jgi:site-specific DNA-methyltransferase (cytosine-N4-specific)
MKRLLLKGYIAKRRPSGHVITGKFRRNHGGSIPPNLLERGNNESNSDYIKACKETGQQAHPARFPAALPDFFIKLLTPAGGLVLDPFAGSNTTGRVAEDLDRQWISMELDQDYVENSKLRFRRDNQPKSSN